MPSRRWVAAHLEPAYRLLILAQSAQVVLQLLLFMYTYHWRSHAISVLTNYALLYATVIARRRCCERRAASLSKL